MFISDLLKNKFKNESTKNKSTTLLATINNKNAIISTMIISSMAGLRRYYLDNSSAILENLPHPKVINVDNHFYITVRNFISDFLGKEYSKPKMYP